MPEPRLLKFTLALTGFDVSLLPLDARQHGILSIGYLFNLT